MTVTMAMMTSSSPEESEDLITQEPVPGDIMIPTFRTTCILSWELLHGIPGITPVGLTGIIPDSELLMDGTPLEDLDSTIHSLPTGSTDSTISTTSILM